jgi:hypothetical protein
MWTTAARSVDLRRSRAKPSIKGKRSLLKIDERPFALDQRNIGAAAPTGVLSVAARMPALLGG